MAVVGVGNMGRHHARNYAASDAAELCAVVDFDRARGEAMAELYGASYFETLLELLEDGPEIAAATVATPTSLHAETAGALMAAGIHVLVEKPLAATVDEAAELIKRAEEQQLTLAVGHVERFNPAVRELKRWIDGGRLGEVLSIIARRVGLFPPQIKDANVLTDLAVHDIDIFHHLLEAHMPDELHCNAGKAIAEDRYDFADVFLRYGQVACFLQVNWITPVKIRSLTVTGTEAYVELEYVTQRLEYYRARTVGEAQSFVELEALSAYEPELVEFSHVEPLAEELDQFLKAVRSEPANIVTGEEARRTMEVAAQIVEVAEERDSATR